MERENTAHVAITSIGGATYDVFVSAPHTVGTNVGMESVIQFPLGAKIKVDNILQSCGGGAANTSVGFARLGMKARFCGIIGDDEWGQYIQRNLEEQKVLMDASIVVEDEISGFSIILVESASGERTVLYASNINAHLRDPVFPCELLRASDWLFLNHLSDLSCTILDDCLELVRKPGGRKFSWNPGGSQVRGGYDAEIVSDLLKHTDILFLNAEEAALFTRTNSIPEALGVCSKHGVRVVCITDGGRGAYLSDGERVWHCDVAPGAKVVDTTGAGDAFAVGVTWSIHNEWDLPMALCAGMLNSASVISQVGAQAGLLTDTDLEARLADPNLFPTVNVSMNCKL